MVGVVAHQRGHVERRGEPGLPVVEQIAEALVGLRRGPEAGELAHRPQPSPVHRAVHAARIRELAGEPDRSSGSGRSASVYSGLIGSPEIVENGASRSGARENVSRSQRSASVSRGRVAMSEVYGRQPATFRAVAGAAPKTRGRHPPRPPRGDRPRSRIRARDAAAPATPRATAFSRRPSRSKRRISQPSARATRRSSASGLTTTGCPTSRSIGRSDSESEYA